MEKPGTKASEMQVVFQENGATLVVPIFSKPWFVNQTTRFDPDENGNFNLNSPNF